MKKPIKIVVFILMLVFTFSAFLPVDGYAASKKPAKVTGVTQLSSGSGSVTLAWNSGELPKAKALGLPAS